MTNSPAREGGGTDVLSLILRRLRLTGSLQFCLISSEPWQTDDRPGFTGTGAPQEPLVPFHIVAQGTCWLRIAGQTYRLAQGDIVAFPFATGHVIGAGKDGAVRRPTADLPPAPWHRTPVLRYGSGLPELRLLCGFLRCEAMGFAPLRAALPELLHASPQADSWMAATVGQIVAEVDGGQIGALSLIERLTETLFIELLRRALGNAGGTGWLAALADPCLAQCLAAIHADPSRDWNLALLARTAGTSRSVLATRFTTMLNTSPVRYLKNWRLQLARTDLANTGRPIAEIAAQAGYSSQAAFCRAFTAAFGIPPAAWRRAAT